MAKTKQISVTTTPTAVTVQSSCRTVTVYELQSTANWPTTDFQISAPTSGDDLMYRIKGLSHVFTNTNPFNPFFRSGQVVGYISLPTGGPATFVQYEE